MLTNEKKNKIRSEFLERYCFQDTDGKYFLMGNPNTVPNLIDFFFSQFDSLQAEANKCCELCRPNSLEITAGLDTCRITTCGCHYKIDKEAKDVNVRDVYTYEAGYETGKLKAKEELRGEIEK